MGIISKDLVYHVLYGSGTLFRPQVLDILYPRQSVTKVIEENGRKWVRQLAGYRSTGADPHWYNRPRLMLSYTNPADASSWYVWYHEQCLENMKDFLDGYKPE